MRQVGNQNIVVTSHQGDRILITRDTNVLSTSMLKEHIETTFGVPKQCTSFYGLDEEQPIEQNAVTVKFAPLDEHMLLRIKLNYILSKCHKYNTTFFCHIHTATAIDTLISNICDIVTQKFNLYSFAVGVNRKIIYDTTHNSPEVMKTNSLQDLLPSNTDTKMVDVIIKESYKGSILR